MHKSLFSRTSFAAAIIAGSTACGSQPETAGNNNGFSADGAGANANGGSANSSGNGSGGDQIAGGNGSGASAASGGNGAPVCDEVGFSIAALPPNLLILLDRSGSMDGDVDGTNKNRWEVARDAILQVTAAFDAEIRFGLATYSACASGGCSAGTITVPVGDNQATAIASFLNNTVGDGSSNGQQVNGNGKLRYLCDSGDPETTTGPSLQALVGEPSLSATNRENAVLLVTDGEESGSCVNGGVNGAVAAANLFAQAIPVATYALGFLGASESEMQNIATNGGTGQPYFANNASELETALDSITGSIVSCTYELPGLQPGADPELVKFYFDGTEVPFDDGCAAGDGWSWTDATKTEVEFCGQACIELTNHAVSDVSATFGCRPDLR